MRLRFGHSQVTPNATAILSHVTPNAIALLSLARDSERDLVARDSECDLVARDSKFDCDLVTRDSVCRAQSAFGVTCDKRAVSLVREQRIK